MPRGSLSFTEAGDDDFVMGCERPVLFASNEEAVAGHPVGSDCADDERESACNAGSCSCRADPGEADSGADVVGCESAGHESA